MSSEITGKAIECLRCLPSQVFEYALASFFSDRKAVVRRTSPKFFKGLQADLPQCSHRSVNRARSHVLRGPILPFEITIHGTRLATFAALAKCSAT